MTLALPVPGASHANLGIIVKSWPKPRGWREEKTEKERGGGEENEGEEEGGEEEQKQILLINGYHLSSPCCVSITALLL